MKFNKLMLTSLVIITMILTGCSAISPISQGVSSMVKGLANAIVAGDTSSTIVPAGNQRQ